MSSDEDNEWRWNAFVEIGNSIHKTKVIIRDLQAKLGLMFAKKLIEDEFIVKLPIKDQELYQILLFKLAEYLDGNTEVIQTAAKDYFLFKHGKAGFEKEDFKITFSPKKSGIHAGFTCDVSNKSDTLRYYIKTINTDPQKAT